jgi:uncharacterized cysteine cluster protein YcgN (CxxCxxCC family)
MSTEKKPNNRTHGQQGRGKTPSSGAWEERCQRCARCCYEKVEFEGEIYYTETPCDKLDLATRLCTVYADRQMERPGCVALDRHLVRQGFLPADCPYVQDVVGYVPPHLLPEDDS